MRKNRGSNILTVIGATVVGVGAGILLGVVIAPKKGKELREQFCEKTREAFDGAKEVGVNVKNMIRSKGDDIFYYDEDDKLVFKKDFMEDVDKTFEQVERKGKCFLKKFYRSDEMKREGNE